MTVQKGLAKELFAVAKHASTEELKDLLIAAGHHIIRLEHLVTVIKSDIKILEHNSSIAAGEEGEAQ
jgi:hypothetical protein